MFTFGVEFEVFQKIIRKTISTIPADTVLYLQRFLNSSRSRPKRITDIISSVSKVNVSDKFYMLLRGKASFKVTKT